VHQLIVPYEPGGYATTYIYRDEKDLKKALWDFAQGRMWEEEGDYPEYDWDGSFDSAENQAAWDKKTKNMSIAKIMQYGLIDHDHHYEKIPLNLDGFRVDGEYGGVENMTRKGGTLSAETFEADDDDLIEETNQEIAESVLFSCDECGLSYGRDKGEVLVCSLLGQEGHYNHCENCCPSAEKV